MGQAFCQVTGFSRNALLRHTGSARVFLTIDRWESIKAQSAMRERFAREYENLDRACEELTKSERRIGVFEESD